MDRREALNFLNLPEGATTEEIKARYLELLNEFNPEQYKDPGMRQLSERRMEDLNKAYDALTSDRFTGAQDFTSKKQETNEDPFTRYRKQDPEAPPRGQWTSWRRPERYRGCGDDCCTPCLLCCCMNTFCRASLCLR